MGMYGVVRALKLADAERLSADPSALVGSRHGNGEPARSVSLEKAWHGLHFLLTGSSWAGGMPLAFLTQGGEAVGPDGGYGPARLFRPEEVQEIDAALAGISDDQLWARFDRDQMEAENIYPLIWDEPEEDLREEYVGYFQELKKLVREAAAAGLALLVLIT